jgi:NitT/TauT family transport system substrate-binding protein
MTRFWEERVMDFRTRGIRLKTAALMICAWAALLPLQAAAQKAPDRIKVAILKVADCTPAWLAVRNGYFKKNGLDVQLVEFKSGSVAVMAQRSGNVDILLSIPGSVFSANERGFDLVAILGMELAQLTPPDSAAIHVLKDSPIKSVKDLAGRSLGTSARHSQSFVTLQTVLRKHGVDPAKVRFVEMPPASQTAAVLAGRLDAANAIDPFTTQLIKSGKTRVLAWTNIETIPGAPIGVWFAGRDYVRKNGSIVERFNRSIIEAMNYMNADTARAARLTAEFTGLDPELVADMTPMRYSTDIELDKWQQTIDMMRDAGVLKKPHRPEEYFSEQIKAYIKK